jgi:hypothetical protein
MAIWYSLHSFGIFFPFWYVSTKKNLATLLFVRLKQGDQMSLRKNGPKCDPTSNFVKIN